VHPISPGGTASQYDGQADGYPRFHAAVAHAQLTSWLPGGRRFLIDLSGPGARAAEVTQKTVLEAFWHTPQPLFDPLPPLPRRRSEESMKSCSMACVGDKSGRFAEGERWRSKVS